MPIPIQDGLCPLLQVFDMPTALRFYRDMLGFSIHQASKPRSEDDHDWVWLKLDGADLMLNTAYEFDGRPPAPDPARVAAHNDTCLYFGCPDIDEAWRYLDERGLRLDPPKVAPYGMKQLYLHDPDGYNLCLQWSA